MSDVILNAGLGWVYIVEAGISTLRYMVDLFNAVISPQYGTYVCDIGAIGGGKNAQNPQGDKIENNQPRLKGRIQQIVQCIGATIFQIVGNAVDTIYAYTIGLFQSLQVLVRYWSVGQWRLNLPYPLFGENVADWNY
ncbi:MAG: hypothetical protein EBU57_04205, partial [Alphaproteobacteria bacterium]|nr:hypothetical protein [Alphaproteobacteria bacterium]